MKAVGIEPAYMPILTFNSYFVKIGHAKNKVIYAAKITDIKNIIFNLNDITINRGEKVVLVRIGKRTSYVIFKEIKYIKFIGQIDIPLKNYRLAVLKLTDGNSLKAYIFFSSKRLHGIDSSLGSSAGINFEYIKLIEFMHDGTFTKCPLCGTIYHNKTFSKCPFDGTKLIKP
jgi:hypothetical protein